MFKFRWCNRYSLTDFNLITILPQKCGMGVREKIETTFSGSYIASDVIVVNTKISIRTKCRIILGEDIA